MSEDFVNRHGHKVSGELEAPPAPEPRPVQHQTKLKKPKTKKVRNRKQTKKVALILLVVLTGLILVPIAGGELVRASYLASRDNARAQLVEFATKTVVPEQKKQMNLSQLSEAADKVEKIRDDSCDGGFTDNLAMIYPRAKHAHDQCIALRQKIVSIAMHLRDIESQVRYLNALAPFTEPIAKPTGEEFAIISAQHDNWRAFDEALGKLSPAASQRVAHDKLKTQAKAIVEAWSSLNTANNNQDSAAFAAAEKKLGSAYEAFRTTSGELSAVLNGTQAKLTAAYKALQSVDNRGQIVL